MMQLNRFIRILKSRCSTLVATAIGLVFGTAFAGPWNILPWNTSWLNGKGDGSSNQLVFQFFRQTPFLQWPLTAIPNYVAGANTVNPDGNALFSIGAKFVGLFVPGQFQYFGFLILLWFALQGLFAERLLSRFIDDPLIRIIGAMFFLIAPALIYRISPMHHFHVAAHWMILAAFYLYFDSRPRSKSWAILNAIAISVNIYIAVIVIAIFIVSLGSVVMTFRPSLLREKAMIAIRFSTVPIAASCGSFILSGYLSYASNSVGTGSYRLNLFTFLSPGDSRASLYTHVLDKIAPITSILRTDYWENYQYLGLGVVLAIPILVVAIYRNRFQFSKDRWLPIFIMCTLLFIFSLSNKISIDGSDVALHYWWPEFILNLRQIFRAAGRFGFALYYMIMMGSFISISRVFSRKSATVLLTSLLLVSVVDVMPILRRSHSELSSIVQSESSLMDYRWDSIAVNHSKLVIDANFDIQSEGEDSPGAVKFILTWFDLAQFAVDHHMSTNFGYVSRPIEEFIKSEDDRVAQELSSGKLDPEAIYLVSNRADWLTYQKKIGSRGQAFELDGFFVIAGK